MIRNLIKWVQTLFIGGQYEKASKESEKRISGYSPAVLHNLSNLISARYATGTNDCKAGASDSKQGCGNCKLEI